MTSEPKLLWTPSDKFRDASNLMQYMNWLSEKKGLNFKNYEELWTWSVTADADFWKSIWEYFDILHDGTFREVYSGTMPKVKWFEGTSLNYAEHIFRKGADDNKIAIIWKCENSGISTISWKKLKSSVASLQSFLTAQGLSKGDRVAAYMPGIPEATMAMLATTSLGAIWSSCSPDFGTNAVIDRFAQIGPKILFAVDKYGYGGKQFDKTETVETILRSLPTVQCVVMVAENEELPNFTNIKRWEETTNSESKLTFTRVPFDHPLWILYSSGTTGLPKAITHSHGGILLEQLKYGTFHNDFKEGENCFWYTTTGWMMWNYIHGALLAGATMALYDGSPGYPDLNVLWKFASEARITHFGTSAAFILANIKAGITPSKNNSFENLRSIGSTGSTLPPEGFNWIYENVKKDVWLTSMSGGTDVCSAFVGGNPTQPVYSGEIQSRALGCKLESFDEDGKPLHAEEGEMVITKPMPSMPVYFWNDADGKRYHESYFDMYPGVWRHGDWIEITPRKGIVIYGRSDATLNRSGIRIGTSEIYRAVDKVQEVKDSLIICIEKEGGEFWMPLFVVMNNGHVLTDEVRKKINSTIRADHSPRHVPDEIIAVPDLPYTISGKKTETPVKKILMGKDPKSIMNAGSLRNPGSMEFFIEMSRSKKN